MNEYLGLLEKHGVIASGYGKKVTFTKGYGKFKKKFSKVYGIDNLDQKEKDIKEYCKNGWKLASITDVKMYGGKKMLKTNLEILDYVKRRLEMAKRTKDSAVSCYLEEDYFNHELMSKNLANYQKEYAVQLVLESLIEFIESDIK